MTMYLCAFRGGKGGDSYCVVLRWLAGAPGEEIAADVLYGERAAVWDEAETACTCRRRCSDS